MHQVLDTLSSKLQAMTRESVVKNINYNKEFQKSSRVSTIKSFVQDYFMKIQEAEHNWRLPKTSKPISYDLHLRSEIHVIDTILSGDADINIRIQEKTDRITLHAKFMYIQELSVFTGDGVEEVTIINFSLYEPTDMLTVYLMDHAEPGSEIILKIKFSSFMNDVTLNTGFYYTSYQSDDGDLKLAKARISLFTVSLFFN